ncbi:MAG: hypothetical protein WCP52_07645 [Bacteroidota bacterium]
MKKYIITLSIISLIICGGMVINETKCDGDDFDGEARIGAKLTLGTGEVEKEISVNDFLSTFSGSPSLDDTSPRSAVEQRNIQVTGWLYTYAREGDEDYHLIIGNSNKKTGLKLMSAEISGLPKSTASSFTKLSDARTQFTQVILHGENYCSGFTKKLLKNPIKVTITGSVFYDTHHASGGSGTGIYKSTTPWEIHPVTSIKLAE